MKKRYPLTVIMITLGSMVMAGEEIAPTSVEIWSGFYAGGQVGYNWGDGHQDLYPEGRHAATASFDVDGMSVGFYAGYNRLLNGNWLLGMEGEWSYFDASDSSHPRRDGGTVKTDETIELAQNWNASARVRVGNVVGSCLFYLSGGITWAGMNIKSHENGVLVADDDETMIGWTFGTGVEKAINRYLHVRIQYQYTDYGNKDFYPLHEADGEHSNIQYDTHGLSVGLSYRF